MAGHTLWTDMDIEEHRCEQKQIEYKNAPFATQVSGKEPTTGSSLPLYSRCGPRDHCKFTISAILHAAIVVASFASFSCLLPGDGMRHGPSESNIPPECSSINNRAHANRSSYKSATTMKFAVAFAAVALAAVVYAEPEAEAQGGYGRTKTRSHTKTKDHTKAHTRSKTKGGHPVKSTDTAGPDSISYTTVTYSDCPSSSETLITVTEGITVTYCPECEMTKPAGPGYTTTYTTTYLSLCPTGMVPETYTITESCTEPKPTWTPGPSHIPQGFTVTTKDCNVCGETSKVTVTEPCGCEAHEGQPGPPTPKPTAPGSSPATPTGESSSPPPECDGEDCGGSSTSSGGSPPPNSPARPPAQCDGDDCGGSSTPGGSTPGGSTPGGSTPECDGEDCGGSATNSGGSAPGSGPKAPPYPTPTDMGGTCPGPQCRSTATGAVRPGINYGNTTSIVPSGSGASLVVVSSSLMAVIISAFAFLL